MNLSWWNKLYLPFEFGICFAHDFIRFSLNIKILNTVKIGYILQAQLWGGVSTSLDHFTPMSSPKSRVDTGSQVVWKSLLSEMENVKSLTFIPLLFPAGGWCWTRGFWQPVTVQVCCLCWVWISVNVQLVFKRVLFTWHSKIFLIPFHQGISHTANNWILFIHGEHCNN